VPISVPTVLADRQQKQESKAMSTDVYKSCKVKSRGRKTKYKIKLTHDQIRASQRVAQLNGIYWEHFQNKVLPDNDLGRKWALYVCRTLAFLPVDRRHQWLDKHAPWISEADRARLLSYGPKMYSATWLGQRLELDDELRTKLKAWSILPTDLTWGELQDRRKEKKRMAEEKRRRANGADRRDQYLANSLSRTQPWKAFGVKRRRWEYMGQPTPPTECASPCPLILSSNTSHGLPQSPGESEAPTKVETPSEQAAPIGVVGQNELGVVTPPSTFWRKVERPPALPGYAVTVRIGGSLIEAA
jgi:hypothetical protein